MKYLRQFALVCVLLLLTASLCSAASTTKAYDWYCKNNDTHQIPTLDPPLRFIESYDAYYADLRPKNDGEKVIYLTFDAGYENGNIEKILNALEKHRATGAFFVLENIIKRNPELIRRMQAMGCLVCNHTATHPDMTKLSGAAFEKQLTDLSTLYRDTFGSEIAPYYRPPQGRFSEANLAQAKALGYKTIFWSFAYADWDNNKQPAPDAALKKILAHVHNGAVLLLHPTSATNAAIMDALLCELEAQGYRFGTLDELTESEISPCDP